jgi:hypothetical protein
MDSTGWVKIYRKLPEDSKIRALSTSKRWVFICYILMARHEGKWRGYLVDENGRALTYTERAAYCGIDRGNLVRHDQGLIAAGLIEQHAQGRLKVTNYDRYQSAAAGVVISQQSADEGVVKIQQDDSESVVKIQQEPPAVVKPVVDSVVNLVADLQQLNSSSDPIRSKEDKNMDANASAQCPLCKPIPTDDMVPEQVKLVMELHQLRRDKLGFCPKPNKAKEQGIVRGLLRYQTYAQIVELFKVFTGMDDDRFIVDSAYSIEMFSARFNSLRARGTRKGGEAHGRDSQRNLSVSEEEYSRQLESYGLDSG